MYTNSYLIFLLGDIIDQECGASWVHFQPFGQTNVTCHTVVELFGEKLAVTS